MKTKKPSQKLSHVISKSTGLPVSRARSLAAKKGAATRKANALAAANKVSLRLHHKILAAGLILAVIVGSGLLVKSELDAFAATNTANDITGLGGKCLDNESGKLVKNNRIQIWKCSGIANHKWVVQSDGSIRSTSGNFCIDVPFNGDNEYTYLQLYPCNGTPAQKFTVADGVIKHRTTGYCLTVRYSNADNGTRVWMVKCNGSKAQKWAYQGNASGDAPAPLPPTPPTPPTSTAPSGNYNLRDVAKKAASNQVLALGDGTYSFRNFDPTIGVDMTRLSGLTGNGVDKTVIKMVENSSTRASSVPGLHGKYNKDAARTNPLYLLKFDGSPVISGFTLQGTKQGHLYNGLRIDRTTNARVSNVKIAAIPGNSDVPPGETFGLNDYGSTGSVYKNIEIDGSIVGSSNFATNSTKNVSISDSFFYNSRYGNGATFWKTSGTTNISGVKSTGNKDFGFNFERVSGTVVMRNVYTCNNRDGDYRMSNDHTSAVYKIYDPTFCGSKLVMRVAPKYDGDANKQKRSDIHVYINGVDKTSSVVKFIN